MSDITVPWAQLYTIIIQDTPHLDSLHLESGPYSNLIKKIKCTDRCTYGADDKDEKRVTPHTP